EVLTVAILRGRPFHIAKLPVQAALFFRQRAGDHDVEIHELIATAGPSKVRHALAADADHLAVLRAGRDAHLRLRALDRRHADLVAERGLRRRKAREVDEVVTLAAEEGVLLQANEHVEVAGRSAAHAGLAPAVAGRAGRGRRARLRTVPVAALARLEARDRDDALAALDGVEEVDLDLHPQVRPAHRTARLAAAKVTAEEGLEQIADPEI